MTDFAAELTGTILVVDDDPAIRDLIVKRLEHKKFSTVTAGTGEEALAILARRQVDLVLLDIMMPGIDGYEVLGSIRQHSKPVELPVIMVSAKDQGEDVLRAMHRGANDYAFKPIDFKILLQRVRRHLLLKSPQAQMIGGYRILQKIGEGGMGVVFEAIEIDSERPVALKILPRALTADPKYIERFAQEAALAKRVHHENIVEMYEAGVDGETHFIAMELVRGTDLADLREARPLTLAEALSMARQIAGGLQALRGAGVIHRDVKPENVIITAAGIAKLTDFGIARDARSDRRITDTGVGLGSIAYASPEQLVGAGDTRSDIYSLGCTLYFALTGQDPFPREKPLEWIYRRKRRRAPRASAVAAVPRAVDRLLGEMMAPNAEHRPMSSVQIVAAIDAILAGGEPRRRRPTWALLAGVGVATAIGIILLWRVLNYG